MATLVAVDDGTAFRRANARHWLTNTAFWADRRVLHPHLTKAINRELRRGPPLPKRRLLDVGCGTGWLSSLPTVRSRYDYLGLDENHRVIAVADATWKRPGTTFAVGDFLARKTQRVFGRQDVIVAVFTLNECPSLDRALKAVADWMQDGGFAVIVTLDPIMQLVRSFPAGHALKRALKAFRERRGPLAIQKPIEVAGHRSPATYYTILYGLSEITAAATNAGLVLETVSEPLADIGDARAPNPQLTVFSKLP